MRSFAHAVGELTGTGACLEALRRTRSGEFSLQEAITLDKLEEQASQRLLPMEALLPAFPAVRLTSRGRDDVAHGREVMPEAVEPPTGPAPSGPPAEWVRLLDSKGALVGVATAGTRPGSLHPSLVLI